MNYSNKNNSDILVGSINVTSLAKEERRTELLSIMDKLGITVCLVQETRLKFKRINREETGDYNIIRDDRGVGTAVIIKNCYKGERMDLGKLNAIDAMAVRIGHNRNAVTVVSVYIPQSAKSEDVVKDLNIIREVTGFTNVIMGGDLNTGRIGRLNTISEWVDDNRHLYNWIKPEYSTFRSGSTLDYFFTTTDVQSTMRCKTKDIGLEHKLITIKINASTKILNQFIKIPKWGKTNWETVRDFLIMNRRVDCPADRNITNEEIDTYVDDLTKDIASAIMNTVPSGRLGAAPKLTLPEDLLHWYKERRRLKGVLKRARGKWLENVDRIEHIKRSIREANVKIDKITRSRQEVRMEKRLANIENNRNRFKEINHLQGKKSKFALIKMKDSYGVNITNEITKTEEFRQFYKELYEPVIPNCKELVKIQQNNQMVNRVPVKTSFDILNKASTNRHCGFLTNINEIAQLIKQTKPKTSAGLDKIPNIIIKQLPLTYIIELVKIINHCLNNSYFPVSWKKAVIIPIPKKQGHIEAKDFRPISLTSNVGKILEGVILNRIEKESRQGIIPDHQFGFRKGHSAVDALTTLSEELERDKNRNEATAIVSLDIKKAFDSVWGDGLVYKVTKVCKNKFIGKMIGSFIEGRKGRVCVNGKESEEFDIGRGVPQGSRLGPTLYNIYVADIRPKLREGEKIIQYADDTLLKSSSKKSVNMAVKKAGQLLNQTTEQLKNWGIEVNMGKTNLMVRKNKRRLRRGYLPSIKVDGTEVKGKGSLKYLGVTFQMNGKFNIQARNACRLGKVATSKLRLMLSSLSLSQRTKCLMYRQLIRSCVTYGVTIWGGENEVRELEKMERWAFRYATNLIRTEEKKFFKNEIVYATMNMERITEHIERLKQGEWERRRRHPNLSYRS